MKNAILLIFVAFFLFSCGYKENKNTEAEKQLPAKTKEGITILPIYQKSTKILNNLSNIAKNIRFVALDNKIPISNFHTNDVVVSKNYIFLATLYKVMQFDKKGDFIRYIGRRGQGPREFVQLSGAAMDLDESNQLIYLLDGRGNKIQVYNFNGKYQRTLKSGRNDCILSLIDSTSLLVSADFEYRFLKLNVPYSRIIDATNGNSIQEFNSSLYPQKHSKGELYGPSLGCFHWRYNKIPYYLEYGSDTIYKIANHKRIPVDVLTGDLKLEFKNFFKKKSGNKLKVISTILRNKGAIFEINQFLIFRLGNDNEYLFNIYNKSNGVVYSTNFNEKHNDKFIDNLVSGIQFSPNFQGDGKLINLIDAEVIFQQKDKIFSYIKQHPTQEGENLKKLIANLSADDNPIVIIIE